MTYTISECPYCRGNQEGVVGLDDDRIVFGGQLEDDEPCPHMVTVGVWIAHYDRDSDGNTRLMLGFGEEVWDHPLWYDTAGLEDYLCDLRNGSVDSLPSCNHVKCEIAPITEEADDSKNYPYTTYEARGTVVFADDAKKFIEQATAIVLLPAGV